MSISYVTRGAGKPLILLHPGLWYNWNNFPEWNREVAGGGSRGSANQAGQGGGCALLVVIGFIVLLIGMCSKSDNGSTTDSTSAISGGSSEPVAAETRYVSARALNCRAALVYSSEFRNC